MATRQASVIVRTQWIAARGVVLAIGAALAATLCGCATKDICVVWADNPRLKNNITAFELTSDAVIAKLARRGDAAGAETSASVSLQQSFEAGAFNCVQKWTLRQLEPGSAVFDVDSKFYGCTDPFAIFLGIPSCRTQYVAVVVSRELETGPRPAD